MVVVRFKMHCQRGRADELVAASQGVIAGFVGLSNPLGGR
jgi:hypothetical protein